MNPFGLFQGFGQMRRSDFEPQGQRPPAQAPRGRSTAPINLAGATNAGAGRSGRSGPAQPAPQGRRSGGNTGLYGVAPRVANLPDDYARQELEMSARAGGQGLQNSPAVRGQAAPVVPTYSRPAAAFDDGLDRDYRVPAGAARLPMATPPAPAGSTASRANAVMAPRGSSYNEALVQTAGNAGLRLVDPATAAMFQGTGEDATRRMLSEFGGSNPAMVATPAIDTSGMNAAAALSPQTLQMAAAGFQQAAGGDRFAHLRPDLAAWARHHQNAPKGLDGKNIVDRFMEKQGTLPPVPVAMPANTSVDTAAAFAAPAALPTTGPGIGLSAEQQSQLISTPAPAAQTQMVQTAFNPATDLVDQVQMLREMYRNNSRPAPGTAGPRP